MHGARGGLVDSLHVIERLRHVGNVQVARGAVANSLPELLDHRSCLCPVEHKRLALQHDLLPGGHHQLVGSLRTQQLTQRCDDNMQEQEAGMFQLREVKERGSG